MNIVLIGDDYKNSDIGLFCKRVENFRLESSDSTKIYYFNSASNDSTVEKIPVEKISIVVNIGNNIYFINNFHKLILLIGGNYSAPISCIVHDVSLEYPAELLARSIRESRVHPDLDFGLKRPNIELIQSVFEWLVPAHLRASFITADYHLRGHLLLLYAMEKCRNVICHSDYASKNLTMISYGLRSSFKLEKINLAYDIPKINVNSFNSSYHNGKKKINILLFSFAFNASKNIDLLCDLIKRLSLTHVVELGITGKTSNPKVRELISRLETLKNVVINLYGFVSTEHLCGLIADATYVWCFRAPTHGETSGTVLRALSFGACPIVSDLGWYGELPEELVLRVSEHIGAKALSSKIQRQLDHVDDVRQDRIDYVIQNHSPTHYATALSRIVCSDNFSDKLLMRDHLNLDMLGHEIRVNTDLMTAVVRNRNLLISTPIIISRGVLTALERAFDIRIPESDKSFRWIDYIPTSLMPSKLLIPKNIYLAAISPISYINEEIQLWYPYSTRLEVLYHLSKDFIHGRTYIDFQGIQPIPFGFQKNLFAMAGLKNVTFGLDGTIAGVNKILDDILRHHEGYVKAKLLEIALTLLTFEILAYFQLRKSILNSNRFDELWCEFSEPFYSFLLSKASSFSDEVEVGAIYASALRRSFTLGNTLSSMSLNH